MTIGAARSTREGGQHEEPMGIVPSALEARPAACRRMRILHVSPYYHPSVGGLQLHVKALSDQLAARGHDVDLRRHFGRRGREKTLARFIWSKVTDAVEAIYAEVIAGRRPRQRRRRDRPRGRLRRPRR